MASLKNMLFDRMNIVDVSEEQVAQLKSLGYIGE